ncbi:4Fe-4S binding protein [Sanyastnella coralliicola]|uniref:4Fe-4S binding protein n=1 Tax=Sanyastnella coralliicola TaxID=3069118 RepID=UPI0027B92472|nr:4Fe-4S dicluster domain-containing protein [Longitalea sp. SCSIO 12813]
MKSIKRIGLILLIAGISIFTFSLIFPSYEITDYTVNQHFDPIIDGYQIDLKKAAEEGDTSAVTQAKIKVDSYSALRDRLLTTKGDYGVNFVALSSAIRTQLNEHNEALKAESNWDAVIWDAPRDFAASMMRPAATGPSVEMKGLFLFLTFGLAMIGGLMYILPNVVLMGPPGIKNHHVFHEKATNRGWIGWLVFVWLVSFYILLYFFPDYTLGWVFPTDPASQFLKNQDASRWFLYGLMYCSVMTVMAIRMYVKYRNNRYQIVRTSSVLFFQVAFAFLIPELLTRFNRPSMDFKNIWPLDYDFFFNWNLDQLIAEGTLGVFMLVWGIALIVVAVPVFVYFFGKRWYCSWVCGCGGLAETLGDPYRQLSDKSVKAWKIERYLIHGVLVFAIFMTGVTLYTYFSGVSQVAGVDTYDVQKTYGFLIGSVFSGVIGTGFYPVMGSRVWCRFGCPLAAYLGLVQRFKSRFRITTNGGQCISCGNCSTYCEMGIDVRWYAQRGQNIVRSSCVGCGICSAVCPRGVLKLENGPEEGRINDNPIIIGKEGIQLSTDVTK